MCVCVCACTFLFVRACTQLLACHAALHRGEGGRLHTDKNTHAEQTSSSPSARAVDARASDVAAAKASSGVVLRLDSGVAALPKSGVISCRSSCESACHRAKSQTQRQHACLGVCVCVCMCVCVCVPHDTLAETCRDESSWQCTDLVPFVVNQLTL